MSLKEKLMKPLLDAQFKKGYEQGLQQGRDAARAKRRAWKEYQEAAGVVFVPDPRDSDLFGPKPEDTAKEGEKK